MAVHAKLSQKNRETLANNVYDLRQKTNMSAEELAARLGKSRGYVYQLEAGTISPPLQVVLQLRTIFRTHLKTILRGL